MSEAVLKDTTLWRWRFFVLDPYAIQDSRNSEKAKLEFEEALNEAALWAGEAPAKPHWPRSPNIRRRTERLYGSVWREIGGTNRILEARALLDAWYIQTGCAEEGVDRPGVILRILSAEKPWSDLGSVPTHSNSFMITKDVLCIQAELTRRLESGTAISLAAEMMGRSPRQAEHEIALVELSCGYLAIARDTEEALVFLTWESGDARGEPAELVHRLMPSLLLSQTKWRFIVEEFESKLLPQTHAKERELQAELDKVAVQKRNLRLLEAAAEAIRRIQVSFADMINQCEERLQTLRVNIANVERRSKSVVFGNKNKEIDDLLAEPMRSSRDQLEVDLQYFSLTQVKADRTLKSIAAMAEVRTRRLEFSIEVLLELFVVLEIFHAFPALAHDVDWRLRILIIIGLMAVLYGLVRLYVLWRSHHE
ncbi:hypothetical protein SAMN05519103_02570 [Rhizobiales bacterium GAS113]|nr:hypothetical protein SAMN05519103_02570 [Rhizobiales bacterium GAS113]